MPHKAKYEPFTQRVRKNIQANKTGYLFFLFCIIVALLFTLNPRLSSLAYGMIDPSYNYAVNMAGTQRLAFGSTFIATYGPLGYLVANYLPDRLMSANIWILIYAVLMGMGVFSFCRAYVTNRRSQWFIAPIMLYVLNIASIGGFIEWSYSSLFILYGFVYLKATQTYRIFIIGALVSLAAIFSLTKFTLGFGSIVTLLLLIGFAPNESRLRRFVGACSTAGIYVIGFLFLTKHFGITSPLDYVKTATIISQKFSGAMALYDNQTLTATVAIFIAIIAIISWIINNESRNSLRYLFVLPALGLIWKYCVVRQDGHILAALAVLIPIAVIYYLTLKTRTRRDTTILTTIILACAIGIWANKTPFYGYTGFANMITAPANRVIHGDAIKFFKTSEQKEQWAKNSAAQLGGAALPDSMRAEIGKNSVDVFPWETSIIAANNLTWKGRPSPFSFESYDPYLDNLNATFYNSQSAPQYIVWHNTGKDSMYGIDSRHILWDEPAALRAMLENYSLAQANKDFVLLKKRDEPVKITYDKQYITTHAGLDTPWQNVQHETKGQLTDVYISFQQGLTSKLIETAIRGKYSYMEVKTSNGKVYKYRFIQNLGSQGLLIGGVPNTWDQLTTLLKHGDSYPKVNEKVTQFRIVYN